MEEFLAEPDDTREELMRATYLALSEHGYAGLTIDRIDEHFPKSKSLVYHHYEDKDDLLLAFLSFVLDRFREIVPDPTIDEVDPETALNRLLCATIRGDEEGRWAGFERAVVELRAQAAHDERFREHFTRSDRFFEEHVADLVTAGVESGAFADVDPEATATTLVTLIVGAMTQRTTTAPGERDAAAVERMVEERLLAEE